MIPFHTSPTTESPFKIGDMVRSIRTGNIYSVTKIVNEVFFFHDKATKPKCVLSYVKYMDACPHTGSSHYWVNAGFHFTKEVCKYCDKEKI